MTSPETRGEWKRATSKYDAFLSRSATYVNKARDLTVTHFQHFSVYSGGSESVATPFALDERGKKIILAAIRVFEEHLRIEREKAALSRLTAPREGLKPDRGETAKTGSTARPRKPDPKGRAHA